VILLLAVSALAASHVSRRRYGSGGSNFGSGGGFGSGSSNFGSGSGFGSGGLSGSGISYGGGPVTFPGSHNGGGRPGGIGGRPIGRPVGRPGGRPGGSVVRPGGGGNQGQDQGFRPGTDCSPRGCPVGPGTPRVTYLDQCYNIDTSRDSDNVVVHATYNKRQYHFSWCVDGGQKYNWKNAQAYCANLYGKHWRAVSIENAVENSFITDIVETHRLPYIWTSGRRQSPSSSQFVWNNGQRRNYVTFANWGQTGAQRRPQPDNNEAGGEECLSVINYFYPGDYTTWHDINCRHSKPVICERPLPYGYTG